jgi:hypothetical protein
LQSVEALALADSAQTQQFLLAVLGQSLPPVPLGLLVQFAQSGLDTAAAAAAALRMLKGEQAVQATSAAVAAVGVLFTELQEITQLAQAVRVAADISSSSRCKEK